MTEFFIFPFSFSEIREQSSDSRYTVVGGNFVKGQEEKQIKRTLNELDRAIYEDIHIINESDRFDYLYWIITMMEESKEKMNVEILVKVGDIIHTHFQRIIKMLDDVDGEDQINQHRISFKMLAFLAFYYLNASCVKKPKKALISNEIRGKKEVSNEYIEKIAEKQAILLRLFEESLLINFKTLWQRRDIDSQFFKYYYETSLKMLESKQLLKQQNIKETIFNILKKVIFINSDSLSTIQFKLINLIYEEENIVEYICDFLLSTQNQNNGSASQDEFLILLNISEDQRDNGEKNYSQLCTDTLIRLVNYANQTNVNTESQAVKNVKEFLLKMSEKIPKIFYNNLSCFVQLLDNEAYHLRNAVVEIMGNIIKNVLSTRQNLPQDEQSLQEEESENHEKAKEKILDALIQRIYDKHAFSRSHVLQVFIDLCTQNLVPQNYLFPLLGCACDRIKDTSANVRKKAIILLLKIMEFYFIIFAASQNRVKFHTLEELEREQSFNETEKQELISEQKQIEEKLQDRQQQSYNFNQIKIKESLTFLINQQIIFILIRENVESFHEFQHDLNQVKRKIELCLKLKQNLDEYTKMINQIELIMPNLLQLLGSKNNSDVTETIKLMIYLYQTNIQCANQGIRKMLVLIWSREKLVKEELIKAYWILYLDEKAFKPEGVAKNLVYLFKKANLTDLTSLEELLIAIQKWNQTIEEKERDKKQDMFYISNKTFDKIWDIFTTSVIQNDANSKYSMRAALTILRISSQNNRTIFSQNRMISLIEVLKKFLRLNQPDWIVVKEIGILLENKEDCNYLNSFIKLMIFILIKFQGTVDNEWYCACEQILNTIFSIEQNPESLIKYLILRCTKTLLEGQDTSNEINKNIEIPQTPPRSISIFEIIQSKLLHQFIKGVAEAVSPLKVTPFQSPKQTFETEENDESKQLLFERRLGHLLFLVGHCALKLLIHIDNIENELKKLKIEGEKKQEEQQHKDGAEAAELDKIYGGLEAEYEKRLEYLHKIAEENIINGDNLIAQYKPWVDKIVKDIIENQEGLDYRNVDLDRVAVLTLCKFMCVSKVYCEQNLPVLFKLLESSFSDHLLKINIIVSIGDLLHKYPNLVEPYNSKIFAKLHDPDVQVRKTTMMVLTHLILNDMMKIRGEICEVALLLEDEEPKIQNIVKLFLHELHKKDQKIIYNLLPEAIGRMSRQDKTELGAPIHEKTFENFAKNIMQYLEKDKYSETLVEKLCVRFQNSQNQREWRNCSFCLSQLSYNEKGLRKLIEFYENYREKLNDSEIMENFQNILIKLKRLPKQEMKPLIEEFEAKLQAYKVETFEPVKKKEAALTAKAKRVVDKKKKDDSNKENNQNQLNTRTRSKKQVKKNQEESDEDDFEGEDKNEDFEEEEEEIEEKPQASKRFQRKEQPKKRVLRKTNQNKKRSMVEEDEDDDQMDSEGDYDEDDEDYN
ncbi:hypothetical protein ABPG74_016027 [Tetrahymena malaccensis]